MSNDPKNSLGVPGADKGKGRKRGMTENIIQESEKKAEVYEFLEEDDEFEEFEIGNQDEFAADVEMIGANENVADKQLWTTDWDDEEVDEDFAQQLRA